MNPKIRAAVITGAAAVGVAAGSFGIAAAQSDTSTPAPAESEADDVQDPQLNGSITADEVDGESEADESARLEAVANVTAAEAEAAAIAAVPGTVGQSELGNENGSVVYEIEIVDDTGATTEVKVDAGDGTVLNTEVDDENDDNDAQDGNEANEGPETEDAAAQN